MKTVWVICETVDLGYHMIKAYDSYDKANAEFERMQAKAIVDKVTALMVHPAYTLESATKYATSEQYYELNSVEVEE